MGARMNYFKQPSDYTQELKKKGVSGRRKAMAFKDYLEDIEMGDFNSERFYAEAWRVSKTTARNWIEEFKNEIDRFLSFWQLKNNEHYSYAKKQSDQSDHLQVTKVTTNTNGVTDASSKAGDQSDHLQVTKAFNLNDTDKEAEKQLQNNFRDLFFIYSQNTSMPGKKTLAWEAYLEADIAIDHKEMINAAVLYLHDKSRNGKFYNLANFIKEEIYLAYVPKKISIMIDDIWVYGIYDSDNEVFMRNDGQPMKLFTSRLTELFVQGKLKFLRNEI